MNIINEYIVGAVNVYIILPSSAPSIAVGTGVTYPEQRQRSGYSPTTIAVGHSSYEQAHHRKTLSRYQSEMEKMSNTIGFVDSIVDCST